MSSRKSAREIEKPARYFEVDLAALSSPHISGPMAAYIADIDIWTPKSLSDALCIPVWRAATEKENSSLLQRGTFRPDFPAKGRKILDYKYVFATKLIELPEPLKI